MKNLNLDHIESFAAVIELGSFSAAAERLGLTQPAVSLQVRQLERRLGATLVERAGRRARPTPAGAELLAHLPALETAVEAMAAAVARHAGGTSGRVRLGTGATASIFLLPPVLGRLRREHPGLEFIVTTGNTADIVRAIEAGAVDIGLVTLPAAGRALEIEPVLDDAFLAIAPPGTALPARVRAADLASLPLLLYEPGGNTRRLVDRWLAAGGVEVRPVMSLGSVEAIKAMVAAGLGVSVLPAMALPGAGGMADDGLVVRPLSPPLGRRLAVAIRRDKRLPRGLRATLDALKGLGALGQG